MINIIHNFALIVSDIAMRIPYGRFAVRLWELGGALEYWCDEHTN
jgi:hypothetical protein